MNERDPPIRVSRMLLAYLLFSVAIVVGVLTYFYIGQALPDTIAHPTGIRWVDWPLRVSIKIIASAGVLMPSLLLVFKASSAFLSEKEMNRLTKSLAESDA